MNTRTAAATTSSEEMSGAAVRARSVVVRAAFELLPKNPSASLNEVAELAGVGRSTLHRHFADRNDVVLSLARYVSSLAVDAITRASPDFGEPTEALRRTVNELIDLGPALLWMHENVQRSHTTELYAEEFRAGTLELEALLDRAYNGEGDLATNWRSRVFWEILRLGAEFTNTVPRQQVIEMILATLRHGIANAPSGAEEN